MENKETVPTDGRHDGWVMSGSIGVTVLLFGLAVAGGTVVRYHDIRRGLVVVLCTMLFLGGWAAMQLQHGVRRGKSETDTDAVPARNGLSGPLGLVGMALAWLIVVGGLCFPPRTPRGALLSLGASAACCLFGFVSGIVGISDPRTPAKSRSLAAVVGCLALVIFVVARLIFG